MHHPACTTKITETEKRSSPGEAYNLYNKQERIIIIIILSLVITYYVV